MIAFMIFLAFLSLFGMIALLGIGLLHINSVREFILNCFRTLPMSEEEWR